MPWRADGIRMGKAAWTVTRTCCGGAGIGATHEFAGITIGDMPPPPTTPATSMDECGLQRGKGSGPREKQQPIGDLGSGAVVAARL
jgi:hypothetical protein